MSKTTLVVASEDLDRIYSALIIGTGALAMGQDVSLYFTFYGLERLKKGGLSRMNFLGLGKRMMLRMMQKANVASLTELMTDFKN